MYPDLETLLTDFGLKNAKPVVDSIQSIFKDYNYFYQKMFGQSIDENNFKELFKYKHILESQIYFKLIECELTEKSFNETEIKNLRLIVDYLPAIDKMCFGTIKFLEGRMADEDIHLIVHYYFLTLEYWNLAKKLVVFCKYKNLDKYLAKRLKVNYSLYQFMGKYLNMVPI